MIATDPTPTRAVYVLHEGGDTPVWVLCASCIAACVDPDAARADIVRQDDAAHCHGCDWHADPACVPGHWCRAASLIGVPGDGITCPDCGSDNNLQAWADDGESDAADWWECRCGAYGHVAPMG